MNIAASGCVLDRPDTNIEGIEWKVGQYGKLRAFDTDTGKVLWEYTLPAAGYSTPTTYEIDGRQYLVVVCSGGKLGTPSGDSYLAFALPKVN